MSAIALSDQEPAPVSRDPKGSADCAFPRKPLSKRKLAANRANAKKSTGPRTKQGKAKSSQNSTTHGLCSNQAVLPTECEATYNRFCADLKDELRPRTPIQHTLFPDLCKTAWLLQRCAHAEAQCYKQLAEEMQNQATEAQRATEPDPSQILAYAFTLPSNPIDRLSKYECRLRNHFLRLLRQFQHQQQHYPTESYEDDGSRLRPEPAWPHTIPARSTPSPSQGEGRGEGQVPDSPGTSTSPENPPAQSPDSQTPAPQPLTSKTQNEATSVSPLPPQPKIQSEIEIQKSQIHSASPPLAVMMPLPNGDPS